MKKFKNQLLTTIIQKSQILGTWQQKLNQLAVLSQLVKAYLPSNLSPHCTVANLRNHVLILTTTTPSWNHQLRFEANELLSKIRKHSEWAAISRIECKIMPLSEDVPTYQLTPLPKLTLPAEEAAYIQAVAKDLSHTRLKEALLRLAKKGTLSRQKD